MVSSTSTFPFSIDKVPRWVPVTVTAIALGYLLATIVIGMLLLRGNDSTRLRTVARWVPVPVASVDGQLIWARDYLDYRTFIETFVARSKEAGQVINADTPIGQQVLNLLVSNTTIERAAEAARIRVTGSEVEAAYRNILVLQGGDGQAQEVSQEELDNILKELYGSNQDRLRDLIRIRLLQDKVQSQLLEQAHFRQILVSDEAEAKDLIAQLHNGGDFAQLAKDHSKHEESRENGGDMGFVSRGQQLDTIQTVLFSSPIGLVGDLVKTDFGYHVLEIIEKKGTVQQSYEQWLADQQAKAHVATYLHVKN